VNRLAQFRLVIPDNLNEKTKKAAKNKGICKTAYIILALEEKLKKDGVKLTTNE
jgi:hypothetical protein